ncbi:hypothetical protein Bca101_093677 [Brassica carinata]
MNPYHHLSSSFRRSYLGNKEEGAGGASHLSGMVASLTPLPVIGVPVSATVWMELIHFSPSFRGVPVATVAINNSTNAALLAIRMLRISDTVSSQGSSYFYLLLHSQSEQE